MAFYFYLSDFDICYANLEQQVAKADSFFTGKLLPTAIGVSAGAAVIHAIAVGAMMRAVATFVICILFSFMFGWIKSGSFLPTGV